MIKIFATGNLGQDAEVRQVNEEHSVTSFSIASSEKIKGEDVTTWINCKKWNAGKLSDYLKKGTKVAVSGKLEIREHEGKYYTSITVDTLEFMGSKPENRHEQQNNTGLPQSDLGGRYGENDKLPTSDDENQDLPF